MGAGPSIIGESNERQCPERLQELIELTESQLSVILSHAHDTVDSGMGKWLFKRHNEIITTLTSLSKSQLKRLYSLSNTDTKNAGLFNLIAQKNTYGFFFKLLFMSKENIDNHTFKISCKAEYDEGILKSILATSSVAEIHKFRNAYETERHVSLKEVVKTNSKKRCLMAKFFLLVLESDRDESEGYDKVRKFNRKRLCMIN